MEQRVGMLRKHVRRRLRAIREADVGAKLLVGQESGVIFVLSLSARRLLVENGLPTI